MGLCGTVVIRQISFRGQSFPLPVILMISILIYYHAYNFIFIIAQQKFATARTIGWITDRYLFQIFIFCTAFQLVLCHFKSSGYQRYYSGGMRCQGQVSRLMHGAVSSLPPWIFMVCLILHRDYLFFSVSVHIYCIGGKKRDYVTSTVSQYTRNKFLN